MVAPPSSVLPPGADPSRRAIPARAAGSVGEPPVRRHRPVHRRGTIDDSTNPLRFLILSVDFPKPRRQPPRSPAPDYGPDARSLIIIGRVRPERGFLRGAPNR